MLVVVLHYFTYKTPLILVYILDYIPFVCTINVKIESVTFNSLLWANILIGMVGSVPGHHSIGHHSTHWSRRILNPAIIPSRLGSQ